MAPTERIAAAIRYAARAPFSVEFEAAPLSTAMELTEGLVRARLALDQLPAGHAGDHPPRSTIGRAPLYASSNTNRYELEEAEEWISDWARPYVPNEEWVK